jgi:hypothetical protein
MRSSNDLVIAPLIMRIQSKLLSMGNFQLLGDGPSKWYTRVTVQIASKSGKHVILRFAPMI